MGRTVLKREMIEYKYKPCILSVKIEARIDNRRRWKTGNRESGRTGYVFNIRLIHKGANLDSNTVIRDLEVT